MRSENSVYVAQTVRATHKQCSPRYERGKSLLFKCELQTYNKIGYEGEEKKKWGKGGVKKKKGKENRLDFFPFFCDLI